MNAALGDASRAVFARDSKHLKEHEECENQKHNCDQAQTDLSLADKPDELVYKRSHRRRKHEDCWIYDVSDPFTSAKKPCCDYKKRQRRDQLVCRAKDRPDRLPGTQSQP